MAHLTLVDGTKAINIDSLPEEAWTYLGGDNADEGKRAELAASVAFLYRCIDVRAASVSSVPWEIASGDTLVWDSTEPQPVSAQYEWLTGIPRELGRIEEALCVTSTAYLEKLANRVRPLGVKWLTPTSITPVWDATQGLVRFKRDLGGGQPAIYFEPDELVYFWLKGQHETKPKTSPVKAAMAAAGVLYNIDAFASTFFERGAVKPFIIGVPQTTQQSDREAVEDFFNRFYTGIKNAFRAKAVNADAMTVQTVGEGLESLSNAALTTSMREDIATAMGVPHSLVLSNASNFATAESDRLNFYDTTIVPECTRIEQTLNDQLFEPAGLRFRFKPQEMPLYQEDEEQRATALEAYVRAGMPLSVAVRVLGVQLPDDIAPESLDVQPEPEPDMDARMEEMERFKRWAKRRMTSKNFDAMGFASNVLTSADRARVLADLQEDADGADAPFPVPEWTDYP